MTSRYEELAQLAIKDSHSFFQERLACSDCATAAVLRLIDYLQAPGDSISFAKLDKDFRSTGETSQHPELQFSQDGSWHFGIQIHFSAKNTLNYGIVTLNVSIQPSNSGYELKFDREFFVDPTKPDSFNGFVEYVHTSLSADYARSRRARRPQIGFLAGA